MRWRKKTHRVVTFYTGIPLPHGQIITLTGTAFRFPFHFNDVAQFDTMVARLFMISPASECVLTYSLGFLHPGTGYGTTVIYTATSCSTQMILQYLDNCLTVCTTQRSTRMNIFIQQQFHGYKVKHSTRFKITQYKIFLVDNKDNTYSDIIEYPYSKCFLVGTFLPDEPGSKRRVMHPGR